MARSTDSGRVGHGAGAAPATGVRSKFHGFGDSGDRTRLAGKGFFLKVCVIIEFLAFLISIFSESVRIALKNKQGGERNS